MSKEFKIKTREKANLGTEQPADSQDEFDTQGEVVSSGMHIFNEETPVLKGVFDGFGKTTLKNGRECDVIFIETSDERVSCFAGWEIMDVWNKNKIKEGDKVKLSWLGKKDIPGGNSVNRFEIKVIRKDA